MKVKLLLISLLLVCITPILYGQIDSVTAKPTLVVLPLIYYAPETSWALGAGAVTNFKVGHNDVQTFESQVTVGFAYTFFKQFLSYGNWRIFTEENKNIFAGEVGWYDYVYFFYGIGNEVSEKDREPYDARFPRLRIDYLRKVKPNLYLGIRYHLDDFRITSQEPGGLLETQNFIGNNGGRTSGLGPVLYFDNRDSQLYPTKGVFAEASLQSFSSFFGSNFSYWRWVLDVRRVYSINEKQVLVWNIYHEGLYGEPPFFALPLMGGPRRMRGLFEGKYRDQSMGVAQVEYRLKLHKRWGVTSFAGLGNVYASQNPLAIQNTKITYGGGGRFQLSKREKLNLRLDLAHSPGEGLLVYLTFGEAF